MLAQQREIDRNTDENGKLLLETLCPAHHNHFSFKNLYGARAYIGGRGGQIFKRWRVVSDSKMAIKRCEFDECKWQEDECDRYEVCANFHYDHRFTNMILACQAEWSKIQSIGIMVRQYQTYSVEQIKLEITKCRLLHAQCHFIVTQRQIALGNFYKKKVNT